MVEIEWSEGAIGYVLKPAFSSSELCLTVFGVLFFFWPKNPRRGFLMFCPKRFEKTTVFSEA